jgi:formylglycine-generating enzyme required for sulfatase activity
VRAIVLLALVGAAPATRAGDAMENSIGMRLIPIRIGTFQMGLERSPEEAAAKFGGAPDWYAGELPRHAVTLTRPFAMADRHVTVKQFATFVRATNYRTLAESEGTADAWDGKTFGRKPGVFWRHPDFDQTDDHPVVCINYVDAAAFCEWLSRKEGRRYRLPTEAEWEYCARAGTDQPYPWGDDPAAGEGWANAGDRTAFEKYPTWTTFTWRDGFVFTAPAASFRPNAWGLYDMAGNAWEWTADWHAAYASDAQTDPKGPHEGTHRVLKGGSWYGAPTSCRASYRSRVKPGYRGSNVGFRIVLETE